MTASQRAANRRRRPHVQMVNLLDPENHRIPWRRLKPYYQILAKNFSPAHLEPMLYNTNQRYPGLNVKAEYLGKHALIYLEGSEPALGWLRRAAGIGRGNPRPAPVRLPTPLTDPDDPRDALGRPLPIRRT